MLCDGADGILASSQENWQVWGMEVRWGGGLHVRGNDHFRDMWASKTNSSDGPDALRNTPHTFHTPGARSPAP